MMEYQKHHFRDLTTSREGPVLTGWPAEFMVTVLDLLGVDGMLVGEADPPPTKSLLLLLGFMKVLDHMDDAESERFCDQVARC